jgi:hypothetical protein
MRVMIDRDVYAIQQPQGELLPARANLWNVLREASQRKVTLSVEVLVMQFGLKSSLPLQSRLNHLIEDGALAPLLRWKDCPICSFAPQARAICECCEGTGRIAIAPHGSCFACGDPVPLGDRLCDDHGGDAIGIGEEPSP